MPRENPPTRLPATSRRPTMSITSSTRRALMPLVWASASRWLRADRPVCTALASSSTPSSAIGAAGGPVVTAVDGDPAGGGLVEPGDHPHGGGFPGTVRAEEPGDDSGLHHEIQAVDRELVAVALAEILYFDH